MKIVIPGGSGQVGTILARHFHARGDEVLVLSRSPKKAPWRVASWDGQTLGDWIKEIDGSDVLINLTGRVVNCRYTYKNRCEIWASRTRSVRILGEALSKVSKPPKVWLQAGTATIYAHRFDAPNDEHTGIIGGTEAGSPDTWRFSIDVARAWEGEFSLLQLPHTRKVILRSAMTMSADSDGIFDYLLWLVRIGLGGPVGSGAQYVSWIHYEDFIRAIEFLIHHEEICGAVNIASPHPIQNREFMATLRKGWGRSFGAPIFEWMVELGGIFLRTESELVLKSRRVVPSRLSDAGFQFTYPTWDLSSADLCNRWKMLRQS